MNTVEASGASTWVPGHSQAATRSLQVLCLKNWRLIISQSANWKFVKLTKPIFFVCFKWDLFFRITLSHNTEHVCDRLCSVDNVPQSKERNNSHGRLMEISRYFYVTFLFFFVCYFSVQKNESIFWVFILFQVL